MINHSKRDHALLSPSSAFRWTSCTKSARLEDEFENSSSEAAKEGTLAHEICELKLRKEFLNLPKKDYNSAIKNIQKNELYNKEMLTHTDFYVDTIKKILFEHHKNVLIDVERELDLNNWANESFGTADCIIVSTKSLDIVDFKYGANPNNAIDARENKQLILYALGAYEKYNFIYGIQEINLHIVQPRVLNDVSSWSLTIEELLKYGEEIKEKAELAYNGLGEFVPNKKNCQFCKARHKCRARAEENTKNLFMTGYNPELLNNDEIGKYISDSEDLSAWIDDLKAYALSECMDGRSVKGYKAVAGRSTRVFIDEISAIEELIKNGIPKEMLYETKALSLTGMEKVVGKKDFEMIAGSYIEKKPGKPTLVKENDIRPAINKITSIFN